MSSLLACTGCALLTMMAITGANAAIGDSASQPLAIAFNGGAVTLDPIMRAESTTTAWQQAHLRHRHHRGYPRRAAAAHRGEVAER